mmetsp:Transcript_13540/g.13277  ORF Transcript_13540/g.13277 Transcript_13540/m.13277 type:complete len:166 (+) Transcript_13540:1738-2235(+)
MKKQVTDLLYKMLSQVQDIVDIPALINLTLSPFQEIRNAGIKCICEISDNADLEGHSKRRDRVDVTFHIHIPYLIQSCTSKNPEVFRNYALQIIANLAQRDFLKSFIVLNKGLDCLIEAMKNTSNLNGMRIAAKGIVNLAKGDPEMKVKLMSTLKREIKDTWDGV